MAKVTGSIILARALKSVGVDTIFFLTGSPMQEAEQECFKLGMRAVDVRHEQAAAMMAHGYSRATGKTGVCITASGPAALNAVTGVAVANDDCAPLVAIGGSAAMASRHMGSFEEMDQVAVMTPIAKRAWQVQKADRIADYIGMAFRHAAGNRPGPVYLDIPADVVYGSVEEERVKLPVPPGQPSRPRGDDGLIEQAMRILENAERPVVIAGSGAIWSEAGAELQEFVERSGIPFFTTPLARGLIPEDHHLCFPGARSFAWKEADAILLIGTRTNFIIQHLNPPRFAENLKVIAVNIDAEELGHNRPVDVGIAGDARAVLGQLAGRVSGKLARNAWVEKLKEVNIEREGSVQHLCNSGDVPIHPLRLCKEIRDFLPRDAVVVVDGHETLNFARQSIPTYYARHRLNPGVSGCMGVGVPFGIGAKVGQPDKPVVVLSGDGAFGFNGMELDTAARHKIGVVVVVFNNGSWAGKSPGAPPTVGKDLGWTAYDKMAEALGGWGCRVEQPGDIRRALEKAFAAGKPALVNVILSPAKSVTQPFGSLASMAAI